jgi:hypothetical protein
MISAPWRPNLELLTQVGCVPAEAGGDLAPVLLDDVRHLLPLQALVHARQHKHQPRQAVCT